MRIPASVAGKNGLRRDRNTAVVVITLQKPTPEAPLHAVAARVTGRVHDLMGNPRPLRFTRVHDAGSVYSLASVRIANNQTLTFDLDVQAIDNGAAIPVRFNQTFVTE